MFFNIGPKKLDNYPINYQHGNLIINLDTGWLETTDIHNNKVLYKGYIDNGNIEDYIQSISEQEEPLYTGNFCLIKCFDQGITLKTDRYRSFPIWYNKEKGINNLIQYDETIWTDSFITVTFNLTKIESKFDLIGPIKTTTLKFNEVVEYVDKILTDKISTFAQTLKQPVKVFLSGGIDTTTLFSYFYKLKIPYEIINCYHTDLDYFYLKNHGDLRNFWGYRQFHYWDDSIILLSGAPGDEFTVRSPTTVNMILRYYDTSVGELLPEYTNSLHYQYFSNYSTLWESQKNLNYTSLEEVIISCSSIILNDWQHWHLGKTISYTPFRDLRLFQTIARLEFDDLVEHIMNSSIQKELITRNNPELLQILSTNKNSNNYMENVTKKSMLKSLTR
jgi:hypothetical protein